MKRKVILLGIGTLGLLVGASQCSKVLNERKVVYTIPSEAVEEAISSTQNKQEEETIKAQEQLIDSEYTALDNSLNVTLTDWNSAEGQLDCARAQEYFAKWQNLSKTTGKDLMMLYRDEWFAHVQRVHTWQQDTNGAITGEASQIAEARAVVMDTRVLIKLGQLLMNDRSAPLCDTSIDKEVLQLSFLVSEISSLIDSRNQHLQEFEARRAELASKYWEENQNSNLPLNRFRGWLGRGSDEEGQ